MTYYVIHTDRAGAPLFSKDRYRLQETQRERFETEQQAIATLADRYKGTRRRRMYVDKCDGDTAHVGWVYAYRDQVDDDTWNIEDWVRLLRVEEAVLKL